MFIGGILRAATLFVCLILVSCASVMDENQCRTADWYQLGVQDGAVGGSHQLYTKKASACIEHGVQANLGEYRKGKKEGLRRYCTYESGLKSGEAGRADFSAECLGNSKNSFLKGFELGRKRYEVAKKAREAKRRKQAQERKRKEEAQKQLADKENRIKELQERQRRRYQSKIQLLSEMSSHARNPSTMARYCTYEIGYRLGSLGGVFDSNLCPSSHRTGFVKGYSDGKKKFISEEQEEKLYLDGVIMKTQSFQPQKKTSKKKSLSAKLKEKMAKILRKL